MGGFLAGALLFSNLLNSNLSNFFDQPVNFLRSFFADNPLAVQVKPAKSYTIALVGDSMTESLGTADPLRDALKSYYPDKGFGILNFGIGSTSILSVPDRLKSESKKGSDTLPSILATRPEIILLESFGNNPLSDMPLDEGLKKQTETLNQILKIIRENNPDTVLVFVATIAPSKAKYADGVVDLSPGQREKWAEERIAYINNHIEFAKSHKIPVINIYERSLDDKGDADITYLSTQDFIHPSALGIQLISQQIADYIFKQQIIPN